MKAHTYVHRLNRAFVLIREGHEQGIPADRLNAEWTGRKDTILDLALIDADIGSDDFGIIVSYVHKCTKQLEPYIF